MRIASTISLLIVALGSVAPTFAEDVVVVHATSSLAAITEDQFKDIFLGRKNSWADGGKVVVVVPKDGQANEALLTRLGKNSQQFQTIWKKLVFTGKGLMPEQVESDEGVVAYVTKTPGAIGLVDKAKVKDGVKAIPAP